MVIRYCKYKAQLLTEEYQFKDDFRKEVLPALESYDGTIGHTNVKATVHTEWNWGSELTQVKKLKKYLANECHKFFDINPVGNTYREKLVFWNFWGNIYKRGDYAVTHHHSPSFASFVYFLKSKQTDSPLIFSNTNIRIRPIEGTYVIFPSYLDHKVSKCKGDRVTISGNIRVVSPGDQPLEEFGS